MAPSGSLPRQQLLILSVLSRTDDGSWFVSQLVQDVSYLPERQGQLWRPPSLSSRNGAPLFGINRHCKWVTLCLHTIIHDYVVAFITHWCNFILHFHNWFGVGISQSVRLLATGWAVRVLNPSWGEFSAPVQTGPGSHPAFYQCVPGLFPGGLIGRGEALTTHLI